MDMTPVMAPLPMNEDPPPMSISMLCPGNTGSDPRSNTPFCEDASGIPSIRMTFLIGPKPRIEIKFRDPGPPKSLNSMEGRNIAIDCKRLFPRIDPILLPNDTLVDILPFIGIPLLLEDSLIT